MKMRVCKNCNKKQFKKYSIIAKNKWINYGI